jgi:hypothetical protein
MDEEVVYSYTLEQAEEDGVLVRILGTWPRSLISHVTASLLCEGYLDENGELRMANLVDLLLGQAIRSIKARSPHETVEDFYSFDVEFPDGQTRKVFAVRNELGRLTLMLPEDY